MISAYENEESYIKALQIICEADVMIYGSSSLISLKERVKTGKLSFLYSERWFKRGWVNIFSPRLIEQMLFYHTHYHDRPVYLLSSGGYAASDFHKMYAFRNKSYKWGYFTAVPDLDIASAQRTKRDVSTVKILLPIRFLQLKHPGRMLQLAKQLRLHGLDDFVIDMIGVGPEYDKIRTQIEKEGLSDYVHLLGSMPNNEVIEAMQSHHIFCFTSDRNEGWGTVLNEAIGCGCCPVSSIETGSTPYLIKYGVNGFSFDLKKKNDLFDKVLWLIQHPDECERMSIEAYKTIHDVWSPQNAAVNLYRFCESLHEGHKCHIANGPCSFAK